MLFGVADGVSICSEISKVRQDYKMVTHKVLRQAEAVKDKILPIDFNENSQDTVRKKYQNYSRGETTFIKSRTAYHFSVR